MVDHSVFHTKQYTHMMFRQTFRVNIVSKRKYVVIQLYKPNIVFKLYYIQLLVPNDICENRFIHILIFPSTVYNITSPDNCLSISRRIMQLYAAHMREVNKLTHEAPQISLLVLRFNIVLFK